VPSIAEFRDAWFTGMFWPYRYRSEARKWEARCLKGAAKVIVVTDAVKNLLSEKYGLGIEAKTIVLCYGYARTTKKRGQEPLFRMVYTEQLRGIDIASKTFFNKALRALVQLFYAVCSGLDFVSGFA